MAKGLAQSLAKPGRVGSDGNRGLATGAREAREGVVRERLAEEAAREGGVLRQRDKAEAAAIDADCTRRDARVLGRERLDGGEREHRRETAD